MNCNLVEYTPIMTVAARDGGGGGAAHKIQWTPVEKGRGNLPEGKTRTTANTASACNGSKFPNPKWRGPLCEIAGYRL